MLKVLLVEDNELNRDMLCRRLSRRGFECLIACDGLQAVEQARVKLPDIIIMDMSLPVMDGWEATKIIKNTQNTRHIPVLCLSAHAMEEEKSLGFECGCSVYLTKPVDFEQLISCIEQHCEGVNV